MVCVAALIAALGLAAPAHAASTVDAGRVLIVGDSITQGSSGDWTWRYRLSKHLSANGVTADFVGPNRGLENIMTSAPGDQDHTYADSAFDQDHDAQWGQPLANKANEISNSVATYTPDYLLVLLGINDLVWLAHTPGQVESSLRSFIANARAGKPDVKMVFSKLLPTQRAADEPAFAAAVADVNQRLVAVAAELSTTSSPIAVVDASAEFVPDQHTWDGTHPNARGELRIAAAFADVLASRFGLGTTYPRPYLEPELGPQQPPQATVTMAGPGKADLAWTASTGATAYWIWTKDTGGLNPDWTRLPIPLTSEYNPWHMDNLVTGITYHWKVQATKGTDAGAFSAEVSLTVPGVTPSAPTGLTVTPGDGSATLRWTPAANATGYVIHVRNVTLGETGFVRLPFPVPGPEWQAEAMMNGGQYEFKVQAVNGGLEGGTTPAASVTLTGAVPNAVNDLSVSNGNAGATLRWTTVPNATGYLIHVRNVTGGETSFTKLPWAVPGPEWVSEGLTNGAEYEFRVQPVNGFIEGTLSNVVVARPTVEPPAGVADLSAVPGGAQAELSWTPVANATGYFVHVRNVTAGETSFTKLPIAVPGRQWVAALLQNGATYEFKLQSVSGLIEGGFSNTVSVQPTVAPPAGPTGLTVVNGSREATLSWTPAANATGYFVHVRNVTAGETTFTKLPIAVPGPQWVAGLLQNGARYEFKLQSVSGLIEGGFSATVTAAPTGPAPGAPTNFVVQSGDGEAVLTWDMPADATCVYIFVRNVTAGEVGFTMLPWPVCTDSWTAGYLINGATYEYRLQAWNDMIPGGTTATVSVVPTGPPPPAPENLTVTRGDRKATLHWTGSSQATGYYIWTRDVTAGGSWERLPWAIGYKTFVAEYLTNGATYEYKVQSVDGYVAGGYSNTVQVVPMGPTPQVGTLRVTPRLGEAELSWSRSSTATGYYVWMRNVSAGESFRRLDWAIAGPTFVAEWLLPGDRYEFKVQAVSGLQLGQYSNTVTVDLPLPAPVTGLTAHAAGPFDAALKWNAVPGTEYVIYHGWSQSASDVPVLQPLPFPVTGTSFTMKYLFARGYHHFAVAATKYGRVGPRSAIAAVAFLPPNAPTGFRVSMGTQNGNPVANLNWQASSGAGVWYVVYSRNKSMGGNWRKEGETTKTSYQVFCTGTNVYEFAVQAVNQFGAGPWSSVVPSDLAPDEGWQSYSPRRTFLWQKESGWYWARDTTENCPFGLEHCQREVQFLSLGGENVWRLRPDGTVEKSFLSSAFTYRYRACLPGGYCAAPDSWASGPNSRCGPPPRIGGRIVGVEQMYCVTYTWLP